MSRVRVAQVHAYGYPWAPTAHVDFCFGHIRHSTQLAQNVHSTYDLRILRAKGTLQFGRK